MTADIVDIESVSRKMRGGSQAYLVKCVDGHWYVAKFAGNPQGTRTLINECIGHWFYRRAMISTPEVCVLRLSQEIVRHANLHFSVGNHQVAISPGLHMGSRTPVDPVKKGIFDLFPARLLHKVVNLDDFGRALVIDALLGQTDTRQCIFVRERAGSDRGLAVRAYMIDHGWVFGGNQWVFQDSPEPRPSWYSGVYEMIDLASSCRQAIEVIRAISESEVHATVADLPGEWFGDRDRDVLKKLLTAVIRRVDRIESLVQPHLDRLTSRRGILDAEMKIESGVSVLDAPKGPVSTPGLRSVPQAP